MRVFFANKQAGLAILLGLLAFLSTPARSFAEIRPGPVIIDARGAPPQPAPLPFLAGGHSPDGHVLSANRDYLTLDGTPWFPVMGEFHFSRYPAAEWEREILKMKAGGIQVISTYIFWIHHEEVEGQFDWTGQRNVRRFVEICAKNGMYVWIRIGPWNHGEVRNGGLPDWLLKKTSTRENSLVYLAAVARFYDEIGKELTGLFWKDGGRIIGVQLENEYSARGPGKGADHILKLRDLARTAGLDAPFYTVTGWDNAVIPSRDVLPVFGGYADGFWWRTLDDLPPNPNYFFTRIRCEENVGDDLHSRHPEIDALDLAYPFLTAEMGGGMELSYHRRPLLSPSDTAAMEVVKLGSGVVLYGYYMFHGGTNPDGKQTTLQESQATAYPNDLPVKSYDFQAPIGEFGQMNPSFSTLKILNMFLGDFGSSLAPMNSYFPERMPTSKQDNNTPRVAARIRGDHGFIFLNNHERTYHLPEQKAFQVRLELPSGMMDIPRLPVNVPSDAYTIWPVNLEAGGVRLRYATAQLLCKLDDPNMLVFFAWPGIPPEFAFEEKDGTSIENVHGQLTREQGIVYVNRIEPGAQVAIRVRQSNGAMVRIIVLSQKQALNTWKAKVAGRERLILSPAQLYFENDQVHLSAMEVAQLRVGIFPAPDRAASGFVRNGQDGIFQIYAARTKPANAVARIHKIRGAADDPPLKMGNEVAIVPDDSAFDTAPTWAIKVPCVEPSAARVFLRITYEGDIARLYVDGKLFTDNFYNGTPWMLALDRIPCPLWDRLELKILPLHNQAPIYLPAGSRPAPSPSGEIANVREVQTVREYQAVFSAGP
jgi:hypothetical protein